MAKKKEIQHLMHMVQSVGTRYITWMHPCHIILKVN